MLDDWTAPDLGISATTFLETLTDGLLGPGADECIVIARKNPDREDDATGKIRRGGFRAMCWPDVDAQVNKHHVSIGIQSRTKGDDGRPYQTSREANWRGMWALVLDDVLEKVPAPGVAPTCVVETKPGSQQWWYVFEGLVTDRFLAEQLIDGVIGAGLSDPGMSNVVRWARLPGSKPPGKQHKARVVLWEPGRMFEPAALAAALGLEMKAWEYWQGDKGFDLDALGAQVADPVLDWLEDHSLVTGRSGKAWVRVPCPRGDEHSDDTEHGYYLPRREDGGGVFKCMHGHGGGVPDTDEFMDWLQAGGMPAGLSDGGAVRARCMADLGDIIARLSGMRGALAGGVDAPAIDYGTAENVAPRAQDVRVVRQPLDHVYLRPDNRYVHRYSGVSMGPQAFNASMANQHDLRDAKGKPMPGVTWFSAQQGDEADGIGYAPGEGELYRDGGLVMLNSWHFTRRPDPAPDPEVSEVLDAHLRMLVPDDWQRLRQWMAHVVQRPGVQIAHMPLLIGRQGDGKTTVALMLMAALGYGSDCRVVRGSSLVARFNTALTGRLFVDIEEVRVTSEGGRRDRNSLYDMLKEFIGATSVEVEGKGVDARQVNNHVTKYLGTSNYSDAMHMPADDRRIWVLHTAFMGTALDTMPDPGTAYWRRLYALIGPRAGGAAHSAVAGWLHGVDLTGFDAGERARVTKGQRVMIARSKSPHAADIETVLEYGRIGVWPDMLSSALLTQVMSEVGVSVPRTSAMAHALEDIGLEPVERRVRCMGGVHRVYVKTGAFPGVDDEGLTAVFKARVEAAAADAERLLSKG